MGSPGDVLENAEILIRRLDASNIPALAAIHLASFPESALTKLGRETVSRYYRWLLTGPHPEAYNTGAFHQDEMLGYCCGGRFNGAMGGFLAKNRSFLIRQVVIRPWLVLTNALFRERVVDGVRVLRRRARSSARSSPTPSAPAAKKHSAEFGILAIATDPRAQRRGVGRLLMLDCEQEALRRGCSSMGLTVHVDNAQAISFYERLGWEKILEAGEWRGRMVKQLVIPNSPS